MALNDLSQCMCEVQKVWIVCDAGDKLSVGDNATAQLMVSVDVEKSDGENMMRDIHSISISRLTDLK